MSRFFLVRWFCAHPVAFAMGLVALYALLGTVEFLLCNGGPCR